MREFIMIGISYMLMWIACDVPKSKGFMRDWNWWAQFILITTAGIILRESTRL